MTVSKTQSSLVLDWLQISYGENNPYSSAYNLTLCGVAVSASDVQQQVEEELPRLLEKGPVANQEIIQHFKNKGIQDRTVNLVKGRLNIRSVRKGDKWYWQLNA